MKRFCIISYCNLYVLPYANAYIDMIRKNGNNCDLYFWDRDSGETKEEYEGCGIIPFKYPLLSGDSRQKKIIGYFKATRFFVSSVKKQKYDGIVFLQSHAAVACLGLMRKNKGRYIVDIRDYSLEKYPLYRCLEKKVIDNASFSVISSPAYIRFLPPSKYVISHNFNPFSYEEMKRYYETKQASEVIRISFVGTVRFYEMDKKILRLFANDKRYLIGYYGRGSEYIADYCKKNHINNAEFASVFSPSETIDFYSHTDLINNLYGNHTPYLDYALSNKLYHAALLKIPILVCPDTYMAEITQKYGIGFVLDVDDNNAPTALYDWFRNLDSDSIRKGSERFISDVKDENSDFFNTLRDYIAN